MRYLLLLAGLLSASGCDFDAEYDRIWCERHPTTPERCPPYDAGVRDAGAGDAGVSDAGRVLDAGAGDGGCAPRLVLEGPASSDAYDCVPLLLRVTCEDGAATTTPDAVTVDLASTVVDAGTARGNFFTEEACNGIATTTIPLAAGTSAAQLYFNTGVAGLAPVFGEFRVRASTAAALAPAELVVQRRATLDIDTPALVPLDAGCVLLPKPRLTSSAGSQAVIAPFDLTVLYTFPAPLNGCGGLETTVARDTSSSDAGVWVRATEVGAVDVEVTASTLWLMPAVIQVHACHAAGWTIDQAHCCNGVGDAGCL